MEVRHLSFVGQLVRIDLLSTMTRGLTFGGRCDNALAEPHRWWEGPNYPFFMELIGHLADEITQRGYGMFLQKILPPMDGWLNRLIGWRRADGIVVIGPKYRAQSAR